MIMVKAWGWVLSTGLRNSCVSISLSQGIKTQNGREGKGLEPGSWSVGREPLQFVMFISSSQPVSVFTGSI
ncbi:hypothetical protein H671_5g14181 [Cricetulus griseus]|nr:hypothetical protein H671_5g14181 [Cricetulus griseus]